MDNQYIEFVSGLGRYKWLTHDQLQCLKTKILIDVSFIYRDLAGTRNQVYSGN